MTAVCDVGEDGHPAPNLPFEKGAALEGDGQPALELPTVAAGDVTADCGSHIGDCGAALAHAVGQIGEVPGQQEKSVGQQAVHMTNLGLPLARFRPVVDLVAFKDRDLREVIAQNPGRHQSRKAAAYDNGPLSAFGRKVVHFAATLKR